MLGNNLYESNKNTYENFYENINKEKEAIKEILEKKKKDMIYFIKELKGLKIPKNPNEENQYRILSFPWCICGEMLTNIKFLNMN